jgi:hypothetical protein
LLISKLSSISFKGHFRVPDQKVEHFFEGEFELYRGGDIWNLPVECIYQLKIDGSHWYFKEFFDFIPVGVRKLKFSTDRQSLES